MEENTESGFFTMKGYDQQKEGELSSAMEDYLEMICRCALKPGYVRIHTLASRLNVTSPSASKMAAKLKEEGLIHFERYGIIIPTPQGWEVGRYLLARHDILHRFFCLLNKSENELKLVEQIEHFVDKKTVQNLEQMIEYLQSKNNSL